MFGRGVSPQASVGIELAANHDADALQALLAEAYRKAHRKRTRAVQREHRHNSYRHAERKKNRASMRAMNWKRANVYNPGHRKERFGSDTE